jgi:hypothetical protein
VVKNLLKQVSDTFQRLQLKVSQLLSTLRQHAQNVLARLRGNSS